MRAIVATDAWSPQINGVVRTLGELKARAPRHGLDLRFVTPLEFRTLAMPGYPEIRLSVFCDGGVRRAFDGHRPEVVHIATEGPIGMAARRLCRARGVPFTTSYHTQFPQYLRARLPIPESLAYAWLRRFHNAGAGIMTATQGLDEELRSKGFGPLMRWSRGVDVDLFRPRPECALNVPRPVFLTVGRVAVEKNLEAFLSLDLPGSKVVVGDGPALHDLRRRHPEAHFLGVMQEESLAKIYASADVFVFPSRTDTFGLVMIEALACGVPVAAYPVMGPRDVITSREVGVLREDLRAAALDALALDRQACVAFAQRYSWEESIAQFGRNMRAALHGRPPQVNALRRQAAA
jgi:glycosyltransferase involved in cell wall biosynthesis